MLQSAFFSRVRTSYVCWIQTLTMTIVYMTWFIVFFQEKVSDSDDSDIDVQEVLVSSMSNWCVQTVFCCTDRLTPCKNWLRQLVESTRIIWNAMGSPPLRLPIWCQEGYPVVKRAPWHPIPHYIFT